MKLKIGLSISSLQNLFLYDVVNGIYGFLPSNIEIVCKDAHENPAKQLSDIDDLINLKVAVIIVNLVDVDQIVPGIKKLNKINLPIIALCRRPSSGKLHCFIRSDDVKGGRQAGEYIAKHVKYDSKIAMLRGPKNVYFSDEREVGFLEGVKNTGNYSIILSKNAKLISRDQGYKLMSTLLSEHSDLQAVFACADEMALGAIKAIKEKNKKMIVVGFDGIDDALKATENKDMTTTILTSPKIMGQTVLSTALKLVYKKPVQSEKLIPTYIYR